MTLKGGLLRETTPSSMSAPDLNTIPKNALERTLFSPVVMVLAFGARGH